MNGMKTFVIQRTSRRQCGVVANDTLVANLYCDVIGSVIRMEHTDMVLALCEVEVFGIKIETGSIHV